MDPRTIDLRREISGVRTGAAKGAALCIGLLLASYFVLPSFFFFPRDLVGALAFTLQVDLFVLSWVMVGVGLVSHARRQSTQDIGGSAFGTPSEDIRIKIAFLQNTLEQAVIAIGTHVVFSTLVSGDALSLVVAAAFLFGVGRIAFYRGYPRGAAARAFGMVTTVIPGLLAFVASIVLMVLRAVSG
jgi:hypothetical protein|uniref:MAPEG family protein n=1 Tax=uncultured Acidovorax sp. TaxID=158751 RepID=UPI0009E700BD|nr:MAPEG family protein [uncultured Acidovorax sp.]